MVDVVRSRNCVYQTAYHLVWCPKYRKAVLTGEVAEATHELLTALCEDREWLVHALEVQPDHVHLFVSLPPPVSISDAMRVLKGASARKLLVAVPDLRDRLRGGPLWSPSYYAGTAGHVSAETIQRYIERTEHIGGRR